MKPDSLVSDRRHYLLSLLALIRSYKAAKTALSNLGGLMELAERVDPDLIERVAQLRNTGEWVILRDAEEDILALLAKEGRKRE